MIVCTQDLNLVRALWTYYYVLGLTRYVAMAADIEKAFLMVSMAEGDRDVLHFLWVKDVKRALPKIVVLRFTRVVFGITVNATIKHHVEKYSATHPEFVNTFLKSIYVDDVSYDADDEDAAFELYMKSEKILAEGGFNLRKFVTNSTRLNRV